MTIFLIKAAQLVLALAILVTIHEFGHFLFARIFGVKVEKFYMFFNPFTSLFKWKPGRYRGALKKVSYTSDEGRQEFELNQELEKAAASYSKAEEKLKNLEKPSGSWLDMFRGGKPLEQERAVEIAKNRQEVASAEKAYKEVQARKLAANKYEYECEKKQSRLRRFWGNTEYGIGWLPLGGYCKIAGMIDESMDTEQMKQPVQPNEFRSKPAWQRLLVMVAGVLFNFLLAILIYAGIVYFSGEKFVPLKNAEMGMAFSGEARKIGFHNGDIPIEADGRELNDPREAITQIAQAKEVKVKRGEETITIDIPSDFILRLDAEAKSDTATMAFMTYRLPTLINQVMPGEGAAKGGIMAGDRVIGIDSIATESLDEFLAALSPRAGEEIDVKVVRDNETRQSPDTVTLRVSLNEGAKMGVVLEIDPSKFYKPEEIHYSLFGAIPRGIKMGTDRLVSYVSSMKLVFTKEGAKSIGGFGSIGSIFPEKWDWVAFWNITAFLSVVLAFMNILPIPALDGGHIFFLLVEIVTRRKPSQKFMEYSQMVGITLLLLLLLYANGMDIFRFFIK